MKHPFTRMTDAQKLSAFRVMLDNSTSAVFLGGAGVSTESGIPDFRSKDGLYHKTEKRFARYQPEYLLSYECLRNEPDVFFDYYRAHLDARSIQPNAAHKILAQWEREGRLAGIVTQNIDGLHQMAGSKRVYELHGTVHKNRCMKCGKMVPLSAIEKHEGIPRCTCGGILKPEVVLYEEGLDDATVSGAVRAIAQADMLIIGGTSLTVYPAAGFIHYFRGDHLVLMNKTPTAMDAEADLVITEPIGQVLGSL